MKHPLALSNVEAWHLAKCGAMRYPLNLVDETSEDEAKTKARDRMREWRKANPELARERNRKHTQAFRERNQ